MDERSPQPPLASPARLELPLSLRQQLLAFRGQVWRVKLLEAFCGALMGVLVAFLALFALDRFIDTPQAVRWLLFAVAVVGCALVPVLAHRWVWRHRRFDQLARLLSWKHPSFGDQLLGVVELAASDSEQARSRDLCAAAIQQTADLAKQRDLTDAVPHPKHQSRALWAGLAALAALAVALWSPPAAGSAWARLAMPWSDTPRYTFTRIAAIPETLIVAHGESFTLTVPLDDATVWRPETGQVQFAQSGVMPTTATLTKGAYTFELPAQIDKSPLDIRIGDVRQRIVVDPTLRPELTSMVADVALPEYLGRPGALAKDVRGGAISLVTGSKATFLATASRGLSTAKVDNVPRPPQGAKNDQVASPPLEVQNDRKVAFEWRDQFGLSGKEPFTVTLSGRADEAPSLSCDDLPRQKVVLDSEVLSFKVRAVDDFGIKQVGVEWQAAEVQGVDATTVKKPAKGERILGAGGPDKETVELDGTFCAKTLDIEPQAIGVRLFVEDYLPGRAREYSPVYVFFVLNAEQHAIWLTESLSKWHRQALEVRDKEMQLLDVNKQLRALPTEELDRPDTRRRIENQANAERANGRRLSGLVVSGEDLLRQAARNPEFGVGHLEDWAKMLQVLKDISGNRMPSVADLLKQAAASDLAGASPKNSGPVAGQIRAAGPPGSVQGNPGKSNNASTIPQVVDIESSQQPPPNKGGGPSPAGNSAPRLTLAQTNLMGASKPSGPCPAGDAMDAAISKQQDLLAEFEKIADELNRVLANLEGSTLVKRLKAASRAQQAVARRLGDQVGDAFGVSVSAVREPQTKAFAELANHQVKSSNTVSTIMDDLLSYFERRRMVKFREVLDDMRKHDVIGNLRQMGDDLKKENALSISQSEFWSDNLDRWAEDLVDPTKSGC